MPTSYHYLQHLPMRQPSMQLKWLLENSKKEERRRICNFPVENLFFKQKAIAVTLRSLRFSFAFHTDYHFYQKSMTKPSCLP